MKNVSFMQISIHINLPYALFLKVHVNSKPFLTTYKLPLLLFFAKLYEGFKITKVILFICTISQSCFKQNILSRCKVITTFSPTSLKSQHLIPSQWESWIPILSLVDVSLREYFQYLKVINSW